MKKMVTPKTVPGRDWCSGFSDACGGYYDKWYRHNRRDEGKAYDAGYQYARRIGKAKQDQQTIECMSNEGGTHVRHA